MVLMRRLLDRVGLLFSTRCILWSFRPSRKRSSLPFDRGLKIIGLLAGICDRCLTIRRQDVIFKELREDLVSCVSRCEVKNSRKRMEEWSITCKLFRMSLAQ